MSSTIFINGGAHRVTTDDRKQWGRSSPPRTKNEEVPNAVLKQQRTGSSEDPVWVSVCNNLSINQTCCIIKHKTTSLFFSTAALTVELNSWEKGKNKMPKQCFSVMRAPNVICCCFGTWPIVFQFSHYAILQKFLWTILYLLSFSIFCFPPVKVNTKEAPITKGEAARA